ncbi:hypothetical protein ACI79G_15990 [Geodermatophilus sp. SYSU D00779]
MAYVPRLRGLSKEATRQARLTAENLRARARTVNPDLVARTEARVVQGRQTVAAALEDKRKSFATQCASTELGSFVAARVRTASKFGREVPVLSLVSDLLDEKNGITTLSERVAADPHDPMVHVWLGEALLAHKQDATAYVAIRTAVSPGVLVRRELFRAASGQDAAEFGPVELTMRNAFALGLGRLRTEPRDGRALHALTRVYLAGKMPETALVTGRMAVQGSSSRAFGEALFTLGRAHLLNGQYASARRAAEMAIETGCSLGWRVLAELVHLEDVKNTVRERLDRYAELFERVNPEDIDHYQGFHRSAEQICRSVFERQANKTRSALRAISDRRSATTSPE